MLLYSTLTNPGRLRLGADQMLHDLIVVSAFEIEFHTLIIVIFVIGLVFVVLHFKDIGSRDKG